MTTAAPLRFATLRAWVELARLSNLPTTFTNVLVGVAVMTSEHSVEWSAIAFTWIAIACFYIAGMALNDLTDFTIDRIERPERPIPSGRISSHAATIFITTLFTIGLVCLGLRGWPPLACGFALTALIILYNLLHQRWAASVLLMGLCRGMVYVVAAAAIAWPIDVRLVAWFGGTMSAYVILLTIIARSENAAQLDRRKWLSLLLPVICLLPLIALRPDQLARPLVMAGAMIVWLFIAARFVLVRPPLTRHAVMAWLAGICLIDAFYLMLLDQSAMALLAGACFGLTLAAQRFVSGT